VTRRRLFSFIEALRLILREYDLHRGEMQFTAKIQHALFVNNLTSSFAGHKRGQKRDCNAGSVVFEVQLVATPM